MEADLAGTKDGISERFAPDRDTGRLIEAEHILRYRWAAGGARGRRVLDAGCGTCYGTRLLAEAGATEVVGVDIAEGVLSAMASQMPANVRLEPEDLRAMSLEDDSFDLVVCFEVIEHFEDPFSVLDELARVLRPDGALIVSSPNRGVFPAGNPHHHHEFEPEELQTALSERFANVRLVRQHDYIVSAALEDEAFRQDGGAQIAPIQVDKLIGSDTGAELYTLAVAGNGELPELHQLAVMTGTLEFREWLSVYDVQTNAIREKDNYIGELEARVAERDRVAQLLLEAEQRLAEIPSLHLQIADLRHELAGTRAAEDAVRLQMKDLDDRLMRAQRTLVDVMRSPSWKVTKPLRSAKKLFRS